MPLLVLVGLLLAPHDLCGECHVRHKPCAECHAVSHGSPCADCHAIHAPGLLRPAAEVMSTCLRCHPVAAEEQRGGQWCKHPVGTKGLTCSTCHYAHRTMYPFRLRWGNEQGCRDCHPKVGRG